ncbi:hypothetical protein B0H17DRAFT_1171606 [Mycena rosella]|uniref:Uncharacterized protein n=1 Tax=Mycena rosella TaxID=1033263 RepID=A0AAD7CTP9_MYCRO|nr:hypothetical protein B0H17DRAFT_1171606 [Mycena rosella]
MIDALHESSHRTYTENGAPAYNSTLSPTLDAFQKLKPYLYGEQVGNLLEKAWEEDPDLTLKIIWNMRSIHDGKAEREGFYRAFGWLYDNHPRTAIANLHLLVEPVCAKPGKDVGGAHGYYKDLLNILALATVDELSNITRPASFLHSESSLPTPARPRRPARRATNDSKLRTSTSTTADRLTINRTPVIKAKRAALGVVNHARIEGKLADPKYRALFVAVARLFSERLLTDFRLLSGADTEERAEARAMLLRQISLAPKWAPTLRGSHDRCTNISTAIARLLYHAKDTLPMLKFPSALKDHPSLESTEASDIMRSFYRRWFLTPLRAATLVTETFMASNRWTDIQYNRVSSQCMKNNSDHFFKHDPDGFQKYLISAEKGHTSMSGATLLPHELIAAAVRAVPNLLAPALPAYPEVAKHRQELLVVQHRVVEAQWKTLVKNLRDAGTIENSLAICDVSGSMGSIHNCKSVEPIFPAVALSLLLAQLAKPPFNGGFITFSNKPEFVRLDPAKSLRDTVQDMVTTHWEFNTDLNAVFLRLILPLAVKNKLRPEDMIKRLFVFSDMQFDSCATTGGWTVWDTNYDVIERAFAEAGYAVPQIVFWDLSTQGTVEVLAERKGVAMMNGFSPAMLKVFMGEDVPEDTSAFKDAEASDVPLETESQVKAEFNPLNIMKKALAKESYAGLVVVD